MIRLASSFEGNCNCVRIRIDNQIRFDKSVCAGKYQPLGYETI